MKHLLQRGLERAKAHVTATRAAVVAIAVLAFAVTGASPASAAEGDPLYDISPMTAAVQSQFSGSMAPVLLLAGGLIGLTLIVRFLRKQAK